MEWIDKLFGRLSDEDKEIIESFNVSVISIRLAHELFGIVLAWMVFILYSKNNYFSTIFKWYSDLAMFLGAFVYFFSFIVTLIQIELFYREDPRLVSNKTKTRLRTLYRIRCSMIFVLMCQLVMTSFAFWISYAISPSSFQLEIESYISHGVYLGYTVYYSFYTTLDPGIWALYTSIVYTVIYYLFVVIRRIMYGEWVYPGLSPSFNPYWYLIVFGIPVMQIIFYIVFESVNRIKNKTYARLQRYFNLNLVYTYVDTAPSWKDTMLLELVVSSVSLAWIVGYSFVLLSVMHVYFLGTGLYDYVYILAFDFCEFLAEFSLFSLLIWFWYNESRENSENEPIQPPYIERVLELFIVYHIIMGFVMAALVPFFVTSLFVWYIFVRAVLVLLVLVTKCILLHNFKFYKSGRPLQKHLKPEPRSYFN